MVKLTSADFVAAIKRETIAEHEEEAGEREGGGIIIIIMLGRRRRTRGGGGRRDVGSSTRLSCNGDGDFGRYGRTGGNN